MKANEFVKKFGWDAIKHDLSGYFKDEKIGTIQVLTHEKEYIEVNGNDLKRLVESYNLVDSVGGLDAANRIVCDAFHGSNHPIPDGHEKLSLAIQDVESCHVD